MVSPHVEGFGVQLLKERQVGVELNTCRGLMERLVAKMKAIK